MGSTGHSLYSSHSDANTSTENYGIASAVNFHGKLPENTGLEQPSANKVTLKLKANDDSTVIFQFKLTKDNKYMTIIGYNNGVPEVKCKVQVDSGQPSLNTLLATGSKTQKLQAIKMRSLFDKSTEVKENQLSSIANDLLRRKQKKGEL